MPKVLVAGVGNVLRGDDGFGIEVVRRLLSQGTPPGVEVMETGGGVGLVQKLLDGYDALIVVDAVQRGGAPGTVYLLEPQLPDTLPPPTDELDALLGHLCDTQLSRLFILAKALGVLPPKVLVVGCQTQCCDELGSGLTEPVLEAVEVALERVRAAINKLNGVRLLGTGAEGAEAVTSVRPNLQIKNERRR